jgi:hypothetical protein
MMPQPPGSTQCPVVGLVWYKKHWNNRLSSSTWKLIHAFLTDSWKRGLLQHWNKYYLKISDSCLYFSFSLIFWLTNTLHATRRYCLI